MTELASTERDYVEKLRYCIEVLLHYVPALVAAKLCVFRRIGYRLIKANIL